MQRSEFQDLVSRTHDQENDTFAVKANQYVKSDDQFYNFKRAAIIAGSGANKIDLSSPLGTLYGMMLKHIVCYLDILESPEPENVPIEIIEEVCKDLRCYTTLSEGMLIELRHNQYKVYKERIRSKEALGAYVDKKLQTQLAIIKNEEAKEELQAAFERGEMDILEYAKSLNDLD